MNGTHLFCVFKAFGDCHSFPSSHLARRPVWQIDSEDPSRIGGSEAANITWGRWVPSNRFEQGARVVVDSTRNPGTSKKKRFVCITWIVCQGRTIHHYHMEFVSPKLHLKMFKVDRIKILCKEGAWSIVSQFVYKLYIYM